MEPNLDHLCEIRELKAANGQLQAENHELHDLCCFLDEDQLKAKCLAHHWQLFWHHTMQVLHDGVASYQLRQPKQCMERKGGSVVEKLERMENETEGKLTFYSTIIEFQLCKSEKNNCAASMAAPEGDLIKGGLWVNAGLTSMPYCECSLRQMSTGYDLSCGFTNILNQQITAKLQKYCIVYHLFPTVSILQTLPLLYMKYCFPTTGESLSDSKMVQQINYEFYMVSTELNNIEHDDLSSCLEEQLNMLYWENCYDMPVAMATKAENKTESDLHQNNKTNKTKWEVY
ncbi:hypothetical protein L345_07614, partial [Ophiophagus hannah]